MELEFKIYELKKESRLYKMIVEPTGSNQIIIVGEEMVGDIECFKAHDLTDKGLTLIGGVKLDCFCYTIPKEDIKALGNQHETIILDIPKKHLTLETVENIQRLNAINYEICKFCGCEMRLSAGYKYKKCVKCRNMELEDGVSVGEVILWTCRAGEPLEKAIYWCAEHNIHIDSVNAPAPSQNFPGPSSCKVYADIYLDDRAKNVNEIDGTYMPITTTKIPMPPVKEPKNSIGSLTVDVGVNGTDGYNTGHSGRTKTANLAWEQARREYIKIYDATTKCKNCSNEAIYDGLCADCKMDELHYRLNNQKDTMKTYQKWLREYIDTHGKLEGMGLLLTF